MTERQEGEAADIAIGRVQPPLHGVTVGRKGVPERRSMVGQTTSRCSAIGDNNPDSHRDWGPATLPGDVAGQPAIPVDLSDEAADVADRALHFHDEESAPAWMPGDDVDRSPLTADREGDLRMDDPLRQAREATYERFSHSGMASIDEPIEIATVPARNQVESRVERTKDPPQDAETRSVDLSAFESGDRGRRDVGYACEVRLGPTAPKPERPNRQAEPHVMHRGEVWRRPLTCRLLQPV